MYTNKHKQTHIASHYLTLRCSAYCIAYIHLSSSLYLSQGILIPMTTRRSCGRCLCGYSAYAHGAVDLKVNAARPTKSVRLQTHTSRRFDWSSCPGNTALQYKMMFQVQHVMEELMRASPYKHVFFFFLFFPRMSHLSIFRVNNHATDFHRPARVHKQTVLSCRRFRAFHFWQVYGNSWDFPERWCLSHQIAALSLFLRKPFVDFWTVALGVFCQRGVALNS